MAQPTDKDARLFWRLAKQRLEDGREILGILDRPTAATYLGGYAVECVLKALLICNTPAGERSAMAHSFRGAKWHDPFFLREQLQRRGLRPPPNLTDDFLLVGTWSTELRYLPSVGDRQEAANFLKAVAVIVEWANGKMS